MKKGVAGNRGELATLDDQQNKENKLSENVKETLDVDRIQLKESRIRILGMNE